jgi:hypothetical protein
MAPAERTRFSGITCCKKADGLFIRFAYYACKLLFNAIFYINEENLPILKKAYLFAEPDF